MRLLPTAGLLICALIPASPAFSARSGAYCLKEQVHTQVAQQEAHEILKAAGFEPKLARVIAEKYPKLVEAIRYRLANPDYVGERDAEKDFGDFKEGHFQLNSAKMVSVYRGLTLKKKSDYDANFNLFQEWEGHAVGAIDVAVSEEIPRKGFANFRADRPVALLLEIHVPTFLLSTGKADDAYRIYTDTLLEYDIHDLSPFIVKVERLKPKKK